MQDKEIESTASTRPRHAVQVVARRTGLSPDALRVWERRHGAVSPGRSAGRQRLYSDADIHRLHLLRRLTLGGHRIGSVAQLPTAELEGLLHDDQAAVPPASGPAAATPDRADALLAACLAATEALDIRDLTATLEGASVELGAVLFLEGVAVPALREVGERWHAGELTPAHEHLLSAQLEGVMQRLLRRLGATATGPEIIVTTPAGQRHGLAALGVAVSAAATGWRALYLGVDMPVDALLSAVRDRKARAVALSLVHSNDRRAVDAYLAELAAGLPEGVAVFAGGAAATAHARALRELGASVHDDLFEWCEELREIGESGGSAL